MKAWIRPVRPTPTPPASDVPARLPKGESRRALQRRVAIAVAACIAGMGIAFLGGGGDSTRASREDNATAIVRGISSRTVEKTFNPKTTRGMKVAKVAFQFTYRHAARNLVQVRDRVEQQWNAMESAALRVLKRRTPEELKTDEGLDRLADELRRAADTALFADGIASVEEILWQQVIVQ